MKMEQTKNTFVEGGYFPVIMAVLFAFLGIAVGTDFFSKLGELSDGQALLTVVYAVGGGVFGIFAALFLRKKV